MNDAEREQYAAEQRERHRMNTVLCPHCRTPGTWTYGGLEPAWLGNGNAKLSEFSDRLHWYGVPELGPDHTPERCIAVLKARVALLEAIDTPYPLTEILGHFIKASDHLLHDHSCDAHGYEVLGGATEAARAMLGKLAAR